MLPLVYAIPDPPLLPSHEEEAGMGALTLGGSTLTPILTCLHLRPHLREGLKCQSFLVPAYF